MFKYSRQLTAFSLGLLFCFASNLYAQSSTSHIVIAPLCLLKNEKTSYQTLALTPSFSLIRINEIGMSQLANAKHQIKSHCGGFLEVSHAWQTFNPTGLNLSDKANQFLNLYTSKIPIKKLSTAYRIQYPVQVNLFISQMNPYKIWSNLTKLSQYEDRFAQSDSGIAAANWIKNQVEILIKENNRNDVSIETISTGTFYPQPSIVVKIGTSSNPGIVIGSHMDTLSKYDFMHKGIKPGADDDGSGAATVLELARLFISSPVHFKKPIYLIWYAAEELGLIGSQHVVDNFKNKHIPIDAVLQLDMTGYEHQNESTIWLTDDYVDFDLTAYLETLINTYVKQPVKHSYCGYACSDHSVWTRQGFAAAFPFEANMGFDNPDIHTSRDTMDKLSFNHMADFAKLGIAFAVELAEPLA